MEGRPEVDYYLERTWTAVRWECPRCGAENQEDYDLYDPEEIWYGNPQTECKECGLEVRLGEKDYD